MPKATVYCFRKFDINKGENVTSKYMATLEAIKGFEGVPLTETAKEVDVSELDDNGRYPKAFKVIYSTKAFPILNGQVGKQHVEAFSSFERATSAPFPTDEKYVFACIRVANGWYTRSSGTDEWEFHEEIWGQSQQS